MRPGIYLQIMYKIKLVNTISYRSSTVPGRIHFLQSGPFIRQRRILLELCTSLLLVASEIIYISNMFNRTAIVKRTLHTHKSLHWKQWLHTLVVLSSSMQFETIWDRNSHPNHLHHFLTRRYWDRTLVHRSMPFRTSHLYCRRSLQSLFHFILHYSRTYRITFPRAHTWLDSTYFYSCWPISSTLQIRTVSLIFNQGQLGIGAWLYLGMDRMDQLTQGKENHHQRAGRICELCT